MEVSKLEDMFKGWFIGDFEPTLFKTDEFEVAVKEYKAGDKESKHVHKVATEFTVVLNGEVKMNDVIFVSGDIIKVNPNEETEFEAITDVTTVVVKVPCVKNDKYIV